jgi:hypothetical protein
MTNLLTLIVITACGLAAQEQRSSVRHLPPRTRGAATAVHATRVQPAGVRPTGGGAPRAAAAPRGVIRAASGAPTGAAGREARAVPGRSLGAPSRVGWFDQRVSSARSWFSRTIQRRDDGGGGGEPPAEQGPPVVEGALIRTEGLGALVSQPSEPPRLFAVEAGNRIGIDGGAITPQSGRGAFIGPRDTPPPPNPAAGGGSASGANAITSRGDTSNGASATATSDSSGGFVPPGQQRKQDN